MLHGWVVCALDTLEQGTPDAKGGLLAAPNRLALKSKENKTHLFLVSTPVYSYLSCRPYQGLSHHTQVQN